MKAGDVLDMPTLGMRVRFLQTAAQTEGERLVYEVTGRPRGFPAQSHVHPAQHEQHTVLGGFLMVRLDGRDRTFGPGTSVRIPPGAAHRHYAAGSDEARVRVELQPALRTEQLLERLFELDRAGAITSRGYLKPLDAARLVVDFPEEGRAARPPAAVQRALARALVSRAERRGGAGEYLFVDEWDVAAPPEPLFDLIADARTYPAWWRPVYLDVESDGPPAPGRESTQHFKGRLPYHLRTRSRLTVWEPPRRVGADVVGDLRGRGLWTLTPTAGGTHVRFDWQVFADKPLLRTLTPVLRPLFRWNHAWAIARAREGLEPAARARATG